MDGRNLRFQRTSFRRRVVVVGTRPQLRVGKKVRLFVHGTGHIDAYEISHHVDAVDFAVEVSDDLAFDFPDDFAFLDTHFVADVDSVLRVLDDDDSQRRLRERRGLDGLLHVGDGSRRGVFCRGSDVGDIHPDLVDLVRRRGPVVGGSLLRVPRRNDGRDLRIFVDQRTSPLHSVRRRNVLFEVLDGIDDDGRVGRAMSVGIDVLGVDDGDGGLRLLLDDGDDVERRGDGVLFVGISDPLRLHADADDRSDDLSDGLSDRVADSSDLVPDDVSVDVADRLAHSSDLRSVDVADRVSDGRSRDLRPGRRGGRNHRRMVEQTHGLRDQGDLVGIDLSVGSLPPDIDVDVERHGDSTSLGGKIRDSGRNPFGRVQDSTLERNVDERSRDWRDSVFGGNALDGRGLGRRPRRRRLLELVHELGSVVRDVRGLLVDVERLEIGGTGGLRRGEVDIVRVSEVISSNAH